MCFRRVRILLLYAECSIGVFQVLLVYMLIKSSTSCIFCQFVLSIIELKYAVVIVELFINPFNLHILLHFLKLDLKALRSNCQILLMDLNIYKISFFDLTQCLLFQMALYKGHLLITVSSNCLILQLLEVMIRVNAKKRLTNILKSGE